MFACFSFWICNGAVDILTFRWNIHKRHLLWGIRIAFRLKCDNNRRCRTRDGLKVDVYFTFGCECSSATEAP